MGYMASMWLGFGGALAAVAGALAAVLVGTGSVLHAWFVLADGGQMSWYQRVCR